MKRELIAHVCTKCGSADIHADAWAAWDVDEQKWTLSSTFDNTRCDHCNDDCGTREIPAAEMCECDNCLSRWAQDKLNVARDLEQRLDPGGEVPAGECPDCGALAYVVGPVS